MNTTISNKTESFELSTEATGQLGALLCPTGTSSNVPVTNDCTPIMDGSTSAKSCPIRRTSAAVKLSKLKPLSPSTEQLLLGTLLGDGSMSFDNRNAIYRARHGAVQQAYCEAKYQVLKDYVQTPAKIVPNYGWGKESCVFSTVTTPALNFIRELCYRPGPVSETGRPSWVKFVNPMWLARLTWEGLAYWYMDDGNLSHSSANTWVANFSTHGFTRNQVELLALTLTRRGVYAKAHKVRKKDKVYWMIHLTVDSTRMFLRHIKPFVHPSMMYKVQWFQSTTCCMYCKDLIENARIVLTTDRPCCEKQECQHQRDLDRSRRWLSKPENRQKNNERAKAARNANLPAHRARARELRLIREADPEYKAKWAKRRMELKLAYYKTPEGKAKKAKDDAAYHHRKKLRLAALNQPASSPSNT